MDAVPRDWRDEREHATCARARRRASRAAEGCRAKGAPLGSSPERAEVAAVLRAARDDGRDRRHRRVALPRGGARRVPIARRAPWHRLGRERDAPERRRSSTRSRPASRTIPPSQTPHRARRRVVAAETGDSAGRADDSAVAGQRFAPPRARAGVRGAAGTRAELGETASARTRFPRSAVGTGGRRRRGAGVAAPTAPASWRPGRVWRRARAAAIAARKFFRRAPRAGRLDAPAPPWTPRRRCCASREAFRLALCRPEARLARAHRRVRRGVGFRESRTRNLPGVDGVGGAFHALAGAARGRLARRAAPGDAWRTRWCARSRRRPSRACARARTRPTRPPRGPGARRRRRRERGGDGQDDVASGYGALDAPAAVRQPRCAAPDATSALT